MSFDGALIGAIATVIVALVGAFAGRRWGLPGLGRLVEDQQRELIAVLQGRIEALEDQARDNEVKLANFARCTDQLKELRDQLFDAHADIVRLNRRVGLESRT